MDLVLGIAQTQKLSPQMIQSMEILQMGTQELQEHIEQQLMENPALELESEEKKEDRPELLRKLQWLAANDRQNRWYHQEDAQDLMDLIADPAGESLYDHLRGQLNMDHFPVRLGLAVDCVLTGLNQNGYLEESTDELAARCRQPTHIVIQAEKIVQMLEPAGVAARTLSECLAIQLERLGETGLALDIARNHLEDMARDHYHQISRTTGAKREEIQRACRQIRALDPRPGAVFSPREAPGYIIPDLLVTEEDGELVITAGDDFLPVLKVSSYYSQLLKDTDEAEVRDYLNTKVKQASWLIKSVEQRRMTLLSCTTIIVAHQETFFRNRNGCLNPLTLADVAEEMRVHESTVSRAIKGKYLQCFRGQFPLSHFFSRALRSDRETVSSEQAKTILRNLIESEDKRKPLSDQKLCEKLEVRGLQISRRTIAKYRDEMGIPSASGRKEFC